MTPERTLLVKDRTFTASMWFIGLMASYFAFTGPWAGGFACLIVALVMAVLREEIWPEGTVLLARALR